ncbi:peptide deformylase [candidate division WOR-3 bacterium]|nr:peptide deformylase [candidate division WOR-3 bacterium]
MNELRIYPDPVLRDKAKLVEDFDSERLDYITKIMKKVIEEQEAVGLAAPQIGVLERIVVVNVDNEPMELINPEIVEYKGKDTIEEGCLSLPGVEIPIERPNFVIVKGFNADGEKKIIEASDLLAKVFQHEIDHLNGVLIIDKLSPIDRVKFDIDWKGGEYEKKHPSTVL